MTAPGPETVWTVNHQGRRTTGGGGIYPGDWMRFTGTWAVPGARMTCWAKAVVLISEQQK
jgi:hypothetical protein